MSYETIKWARGSTYSDRSGSFRSSIPNSVDMANVTNSYEGDRHIDDKRQFGLTIASLYYKNEPVRRYTRSIADTTFSGFTATTTQSESSAKQVKRGLKRRTIAIILFFVGLVAIAAAITLSLVLTLKHAVVVTMNVTVDRRFNPEYNDKNSSEYMSFEQDFSTAMDQIYKTSNIKGYSGNQIQEIKNGSIIVIFIIVIEVKHVEEPPRKEALKAVITEQPTDTIDKNIVIVAKIRIRKASVSVELIEDAQVNPIGTTKATTQTTMTASTTTISTATITSTTPTTKTSATTPTSTTTSTITTKATTYTSTTSSITSEPNNTTTTSIQTATVQPAATSITYPIIVEPNNTNTKKTSTTATTAQLTTASTTSPPMPKPNTNRTTTSTPKTATQLTTTRTEAPPISELNTTSTTRSTSKTIAITTRFTSTASSSMGNGTTTLPKNTSQGSTTATNIMMMCEGAIVILGGSASIICRFLFCGQSFSLAITHSEEIIFSENNISSSIYRPSNNTYIHISIRQQGEAMVNLTLHQVKFNDSGEYIINLDGGNFTDKAKLTLKEDTTSTSGTTITIQRGYSNATTSFTMTPPTSNATITNATIISSTTTTPVQTTTTRIETSVAFNKNNYTSILGTPLQLICMVIGWNGNLSINRTSKLNQSEVNVLNLVNNKTVSIYPGFAVNRTFSGGKLYVFLSILNMTCGDEETYYCRSGSASDVATVKQREIPKLQLPDIMIRDDFHGIAYPFLCEGSIENPGEILIAEVNRNGTFYFYEGYKEGRANIATDCGKKQILTFYINGKFTQDWDNAKIRCIAINNVTNGDTGIRLVSEEKTVRLVPAGICVGVTQGSNISHPHSDCELFLTCQTGVPVLGKCQQGECFFDNVGKCRPPTCPFVYCRDVEVDIGDTASITCSLLFCNDSFSLSIKHSEDTLFSNSSITGNISQSSDNRDILISVTRGRGAVTVTLIKTNCNHIGEYIIILDRGNFTDRAYLTLKVRPGRPTIKLPQSIVASTQANITCTGEQGVPQQNMYMEVMFSGSNFSKYENTMLTTNSHNCSNMGTLVMNFLVVEKWNCARVRCIIGDNSTSRLESDVHEINTTRSGVSFSPSETTGYINDTVQMNCTVTGILSSDAVIISRLIQSIGGEEVLSIITFGNATKNNLTGIHFSTTVLSAHDMIVHITINFLQCSDKGTYYCKTGNRTAATSLAIWSKPDKPNLLLPLDVVSGGYGQLGDPFVCEGNVGYPGGKLLSLINSNGSFKEVQPFKVNLTKGNVSSCQKVDRFEFYLEKFTTDLHNSTVRCVATNNETLPIGQSAQYDEKVLLLVPGNTCYGMTDGVHLPYPYPFYDCGKYLFCSANRTYVRDGKCKVGECYYTDMSICDKERTTTTTEPTTTTQRTCPSITCLGAETVINSAATINCEMLVCGNDFDLTIDLESKVQFRETIRGNHSSQFLSNAHIDLVVKSLKANLSIVFENVLCNQSGVYNISIYGRNTSNVATLKVRVNPEKPNITAPPNIYMGQKAIFTCIGQLGIPNASMFWQLMLPGGNFESYGVKGSPNILKSDCSVIGNWTIEVYPEELWNGSSIRCVTKAQGNATTAIYSDTILITLKQADIYFVPPSSSGYIGSQHSITCQARDMTNITSVKIERQTASGVREEVVSIALDGSKTSNFNGIRINSTSTINKTTAAIHVNFDNLTCTDKGDYFCTIGVFSSRGRVDVLSLPKKPTIALPLQLIEGSAFLTFTCTGEIGYPAGYIVAETNRSGAFVEYIFDRKTPKIDPGNCSTTYTLEFGNNVTRLDWNNTAMRCVAKSNNTIAGSTPITSDEVTIRLIPANFCVGGNVTNYKHPYVCQLYVACAGEGTNLRPVVNTCGKLCFNPTFNGCDDCKNVAGCNIV